MNDEEKKRARAFEEARAFAVREIRTIADELERASRTNRPAIESVYAKLKSARGHVFTALFEAP